MPTPQKILAIVPCFNEALSIGEVLDEFAALDFPCDVLVLDDGSTDGTMQAAQQKAKVIRFEQNRGLAVMIDYGITYALDHGYDFCVQIDGDGQHIPAHIRTLLQAYEQNPANMTIGCRYRKFSQMMRGLNRNATLILSLLLGILYGRWFWDTTSGMRMLDRKGMEFFRHHIDADQPDAVMLAQALHGKLTVCEVPVKMRHRLHGVSKFKGWPGVCFFIKVVRIIIWRRFGGK